MNSRTTFWLLCGLLPVVSACVGEIRKTTTAETATQQLLVTTSIERALEVYEPELAPLIDGRKVFIDTSKMDGQKIPYSESALKNICVRNGATMTLRDQAEIVLEVRTGAVGIVDRDFGFGVPELPFPLPNTTLSTLTPSLYIFRREKQEGWAKFIILVLDAPSGTYIWESNELWGTSYYSKWTILGIGPFDWSNDIYPGLSSSVDERTYRRDVVLEPKAAVPPDVE